MWSMYMKSHEKKNKIKCSRFEVERVWLKLYLGLHPGFKHQAIELWSMLAKFSLENL